MPDTTQPTVNDLHPYWMPFTANRQFKAAPRQFVSARDMHYTTDDGRQVLDGISGMWCVNAGHGRAPITEAIRAQAGVLDYATAFQMGHPLAFELAGKLTSLLPGDIDNVFFASSGSEAVDTALKIALAYHQVRGEQGRTRFIGRERGYHGVGFGGTSVGGIPNNRKQFGNLLGGVDHLPHTHDPARNAYSRGQPEHGAEFADALEWMVEKHGADTICDAHGILLIFDEVITGFGRLGASFAAEKFAVQPDMITMAKGLTNGAVPMSAIGVRAGIYDTLMTGPENAIELFHGYTYSAHPLACAAGIATLDLYRDEGLFERAAGLAPYWEQAVHSLKGSPFVIDIRNIGLVGAVELTPREDAPGARVYDVFLGCYNEGVLVRQTGDIIALAPPLIVTESQIDQIVETLRRVLTRIA